MNAGIARAADRIVGWLSTAFLILGGAALAALVVLLLASSVRRYVIGTPIAHSEDIAGLLFIPIAFFGMAEGYRAGRQLRIQIVWRFLPSRLQQPLCIIGDTIALCIVVMATVQCFVFAETSLAFGSRIVGSGLLLWPWMMQIPIGLGLFALTIVAHLLSDLATTGGKRS